jgi:protein tyrosine/serine phosphatase
MLRALRVLLGITIAGTVLAAPVALAFHQIKQMREFRVVREGVLYRSGQMRLPGLQRAVHDFGIRTVITLRDKATSGSLLLDEAEEEYCEKEEIRYFRFPLRNWEAPDGSCPAEENVRLFRAIMNNPANYPVLIHCHAGIHRTGAYCAVFRMEYDHWDNADAIAEMKACGYANLDNEWDVLGYVERYRPTWAAPEQAGSRTHHARQVKRW